MKVYVYSMAMERQKAIVRIESFRKEITENIIKLNLYADSIDRQHWIDELSTWFSDINSVCLKPKGSKLNREEYDDLVFGEFGDDISDVRSCIHVWQIKNRRSKKYPNIDIGEETVDKTFLSVAKIKSYLLNLFCSKNSISRIDIRNELNSIFKQR